MFTDLNPVTEDYKIKDMTAALSSSAQRNAKQTFLSDEAADIAAKAKHAAAVEAGINSNRDLLASPTKLDKLVVENTTDIYPYVKRPSFKDAEMRTDAVDKGMGDNPLAGSATAIKEKFKAALADPRYATVSHAQLLDAVKKDHLATPGADGKSLLTKAHEFKYKKDNGPFRFFSDKGDENVVALPGYEKFKQDEKAKHPYDTSLAESVAFNVGATALMTGLAVATGGAAAPAAGAMALRLAASAAVAYPEMAIFDKAANEVAANRSDPQNPSGGNLLAELAVGAAGLLIAHKVVGVGTGAALSKAMQFEKTAAGAAAIAGYTGKATEALASYKAGRAAIEETANAAKAVEAEKVALRVKTVDDFKTKLDSEVVLPETQHTKSLIERSSSTFGAIDPVNAHVMGLTVDELQHTKPSVLFTALSDEGGTAVQEAVKAGESIDTAIITRFNQEAALKKAAMLEDGTSAKDLVGKVSKDYGLDTYQPLIGEPKLVKKTTKGHKKSGKQGPESAELYDVLVNGSKVVAGVAAGGALLAGTVDDSEAAMLSSVGGVVKAGLKGVKESGGSIIDTASKVINEGKALHLEKYKPQSVTNEAIDKYVPAYVGENVTKLFSDGNTGYAIRVEKLLDKLDFVTPKMNEGKIRLSRVDDISHSVKTDDFKKSEFATSTEWWKPEGKFFAENPQDAAHLRNGNAAEPRSYVKQEGKDVKYNAFLENKSGELQDFSVGRPAEGSVVASIDEQALRYIDEGTNKHFITNALNDMGVTHLKIDNVDGIKGTSEIIQLVPNASRIRGRATLYGTALTAGATATLMSGNTEGEALGQNTLDVAAEKGVLSKLADFVLPTSAYAGPLQASGAVVSKVVGETLLEKGTKLLESIFEAGYIGLPVKPGQVTMNPAMKQVQTAPALGRTAAAYNATVSRTNTFMDGLVNAVNSPNFFASVYGKVEHRITNQMASMQSAIAHDTESGLKVVSNILTPALKGEKAGAEIAAKMKPIQDAYNEVALPLRAIEIETQKAEGVIKNLEDTLGSGSDDAYINARIKEEKAKLTGLSQEYATYTKQYPSVSAAYDEAKHELLTTYRTSRISYALEEPGLMKDPRYAALYTPEERAAVQQLTDVLGHYKGRAQEAGMPVLDGRYNRHSMDKTKLNEAFSERLKVMGINTDSKNISLSSFLERSKYSKQMIPDIQRNMLEYIPDAERRINVATLWDKTNENGWHAFSQNDLIKGNKVWNDHFEKLKKAYNPQENTLMNDLVNKYTSIETARLLFLAPSAAFKHFFKNEGTWATLGFFNSMKHIPEAAEIASRNAVNESFYRLGLDTKVGNRSQRDLFARAVTKQRHMLNPLDGMEKDPGVVSKVDEWIQKVNNVGGVGIQAVEAFDRTHTVLAALDMAAKKGMTAEQAMGSIYDTILKNNFLGGGLNPAWMRSPKVRALMLFQGTPFKIMERRLMNAMALGDDVKTAWGVIKNQDVSKNLEELQSIGKYMLDGQNEFKQNMIFDSLTAHKDAYGNSISAQFVREAVIVGGVIAGGSAVGMDFHKHSLHIPFLKEGAAPELAVNPLTKAAWETSFGPVGQDDKTFFPARFLQNYVKTTGGIQPLMLHKFQRLSNNDIPAIYKDSAFKYLFSVPSSK